MKILISKDQLKKATKSIKKQTNQSHTMILTKLTQVLGFKDYNEYEQSFIPKSNNFIDKNISILKRKIIKGVSTTKNYNIPSHLNQYDYKTLNEFNFEGLLILKEEILEKFENKVTTIFFIDEMINKKKIFYKTKAAGYGLLEELKLFPYVNDLQKTELKQMNLLINEEYEINEDSVFVMVDIIAKKYKSSKLDTTQFEQLIKKETTQELSDFLLKNNLIEIKRYSESIVKNNNYEDFIAPLILKYVYRKTITINEFKDLILERVNLELKYKDSFLFGERSKLSLPNIKVPIEKTETCLNSLNKIRENTSNEHPIFLGEKDQKLSSDFGSSILKLSKNNYKENFYIRTGISSAGYEFTSTLLFQHAINDSGFMHFDFSGDNSQYVKLYSMVKFVNEKDHIHIFTEKTLCNITKEMVKSFIYNKKKVLFMMPDQRYAPHHSIMMESMDKFKEIRSWILEIKNKSKSNYILSFYETNELPLDFQKDLAKEISLFNKNNYSIILTDWSIYSLKEEKKDLLKLFPHKVLMKSYEFPKSLEDFGIFDFKKDFDGLNFIYAYKDVYDLETVYKSSISEIPLVDELYLKLPNEYK